MIRIVCTRADAGMAANVGGPVTIHMKTFDVDLPEIEAWLKERGHTYEERTFTGIEIIPVAQEESRG
jgi:hypothetical protein